MDTMDHSLAQLDYELERLTTNDSVESSSSSPLFSRNNSNTSMTTTYSHTPSTFLKINANPDNTNTSTSTSTNNNDSEFSTTNSPNLPTVLEDKNESSLTIPHLSLKRLPTAAPSLNGLTTSPTNELIETTANLNQNSSGLNSKWCVILVGLPATGKSSITRNLVNFTTNYFRNDVNFKMDCFNAGNFRRKLTNFKSQTSNFFDFNDQNSKFQRERFARIALDHLLNSLISSSIDVGVFDATNSTKERREYIFQRIKEKGSNTGITINTLLLHIKCTDEKFYDFNLEGKTRSPDYINTNYDIAKNDFRQRLQCYKDAFEDVTDEEIIRYNSCQKCCYVEMNNIGKEYRIREAENMKGDQVYNVFLDFVRNYHDLYGTNYEKAVDSHFTKY